MEASTGPADSVAEASAEAPHIDIFNPDNYLSGPPFAMFKHMRATRPIWWHDEPGGRGFWAVTRHADIIQISRDPGTFSSQRGATFLQDYPEGSEDLDAMRFMLLNMDPPNHAKYRNLIRSAFLPRNIAALEQRIRERCHLILDHIDGNDGDFVTQVAGQLPVHVIAEFLGIPAEDREMVFDWGVRLVGFDDPNKSDSYEDSKLVALQVFQYAGELAQRRYDSPTNDLISTIMHAQVDGAQLTPMEFASFFMLLIVAGHETTRNTLAGGMLALLQHPAELARLVADRSLLPTAVDEMLRWTAAINYFRRTATRDVELHGQKIKEGDKVVMFYSSANRDETVFQNPDVFDVGRKPNDHLAFGIGQHMCLGNNLARLEIRLMFEALIERFPHMELAGPVERMRSNFVNGIVSLPVSYRRAASVAAAE